LFFEEQFMPGRSAKRKSTLASLQARLPPAGTNQWRAAESLLALLDQVDAQWPTRSKASDGTIGDAAHQSRDSDHNPWVRDGMTGVVTAIDITHDPVSGCDANGIVSALVSSRDLRIKYIIWNRRIINSSVSPWLWRTYRGANPHTAHFHLSVSSNKALYDDTRAWDISLL
jgi:hypothetical protein